MQRQKNNVLVLGKGSIRINDTTIQVKDELKTNCTIPNKEFILPVHYNGDDSYLFVNSVNSIQPNSETVKAVNKAVNSEIEASKLCLGSFSDNSSLSYFIFIGKIYHFSVDYPPVTTDKI